MSFNESKYQFPLKTPSQSFTGKISRLLSAVAILDHIDIAVLTTRGEACHGILSRLRLPTNPVPLPSLEMQQSCRGLLSLAQVDRPAAKRKALLWAGKAPTCGWLAGPMQDLHTFTAH